MENFNIIPNTGTYGSAIALINANFSLTKEQLERLSYSREGFCGMYETDDDLEAAYPHPTTGSFAYVGTSFPMDVYTATNGVWAKTIEDGYSGGGIDLTQYADKASLTALAGRVTALENAGYVFIGIATPAGAPSPSQAKRFALAWAAGTYTYYGGFVLNSGEMAVLMYNGSAWSGAKTDIIAKGVVGGYDTTPTEDSEKPITSGGVYTAMDELRSDMEDELSNVDMEFGSGEYVSDVIIHNSVGQNESVLLTQGGITSFVFNEIDINDIDNLNNVDYAYSPSQSQSKKTSYYTVVTFRGASTTQKVKIGTMVVISDGLARMVTEVMTTRYTLDASGNLTGDFSNNDVFTIYRSTSGNTWTQWHYVNESIWTEAVSGIRTDLTNYYTKSQTYSKTEVDNRIAAINQFEYIVVNSLPYPPSANTMRKIYLIPSAHSVTQNVKDEYITIQDGNSYKWEQIGSTAVDLSGYSTTAEMNTAINAAIASALISYYTKTQVDTLLDEKQNVIDDLATIRSGAASGATAVQPAAIADFATTDYVGEAIDDAIDAIPVDDEPTADSENLAESGGIYKWIREIGSKANSAFNSYFLDLDHVFSGETYNYSRSSSYDTAWVCLMQEASQVTITGATPFRIRYFSSLDVLNESTNISYNTTGVVPTGAKLALVAFLKSSNPSGYDNLVISQDNLVDMMSDNFPKGLYMHKNHIMSITHAEQTYRYVLDKDWDCFHVVLGGEEKINISGFSGNYRFFDIMDVFTGENVYTNLIETNSTGIIPEGAVMCTISVRKEDYPNGYGDFRLIRTWTDNKDDIRTSNLLVNKGFYIDYNHVLSVNIANETIHYYGLSSFDCAIINVEGCSSVILHGVTSDQNYRFFNSTDILDGGLETNIYDKYVGVNKSGVVPEGAVICVCSMRKTDYPDGYNDFYLERQYNNGGSGQGTKKKLRMLLIGNSATDDALSYVPFIMQNMGVDVEYQIGIAMMSSSTLEDHLDNFENETAAYGFRLYTEGTSWQNYPSKTIQWMLDNYQWDIVSLQQAGPQKIDTYQPYLNQLINLISGYVDYPIKFIWYQTHIFSAKSNGGAPRSEATITEYYEAEAEYTQGILENTLCEYVVPVSTAIQNARGILALKTIGDYADNPNNDTGFGYLNYYDGVHLQEGLPCQIAAYTFILAILDIYGFKEYSINGETTRVTSEWTAGKSIPSPHGTPIGSTDVNCLMAQKCAIMAIKNPFEVTDMSYIINPT